MSYIQTSLYMTKSVSKKSAQVKKYSLSSAARAMYSTNTWHTVQGCTGGVKQPITTVTLQGTGCKPQGSLLQYMCIRTSDDNYISEQFIEVIIGCVFL